MRAGIVSVTLHVSALALYVSSPWFCASAIACAGREACAFRSTSRINLVLNGGKAVRQHTRGVHFEIAPHLKR